MEKLQDVENLYERWVEDDSVKLEPEGFYKSIDGYLENQEKEICGKCVPCRDGVPRIKEIMQHLSKGEASAEELSELEALVFNLRSARCAIGVGIGRNLEVVLANNYNLLVHGKEAK